MGHVDPLGAAPRRFGGTWCSEKWCSEGSEEAEKVKVEVS